MADTFLSLADLALINSADVADYGISDLLDEAPLIRALAAEAVPGTTHTYVKQTGAPSVGFRTVNQGRENKDSTDAQVVATLKLLDGSFSVDKAVADQYRFGPEAYLGREAARHLKAGFFKLEQVLINGQGTGGDAAGFAGLKDASGLNDTSDEMVVDAGGQGGAATYSSVWAIRTGSDLRDAVLISGMNGNLEIGESIIQAIEDQANGGRFTGYHTPIMSWFGLQIGGARSVGRLANINTTTTLTDDMISDLIGQFPSGRGPNLLVMSRRSLKQLQQSRTATNATGAPAPFPTESFGVPIIVSDAVIDTETQLVTSGTTTTAGA